MKCSINNCNKKYSCKGLCQMHYARMQRSGTIELIPERIAQGGNHKHNMSGTPEYRSWSHMKDRCLNSNCKNYFNYGERGITVCKEWIESFAKFYEDMGLRPSPEYSLNRINNDGNYESSNCEWASPKEQANNTRSNKFIYFNGKSQQIEKWSSELSLSKPTLQNRLKRGDSIKEAFTNPSRHTHCKNGHEYTLDNTLQGKRQRVCRACAKERIIKFKQRKLQYASS